MKRMRLLLAATATVAGLAAGAAAVTTSAHATTVYPWTISTSATIVGDLAVGNVATLNVTLTNTSTVDDPYGSFGWILLPKTVKRTNTPAGPDPLVLCEAYRGHQGGLTQAVYDDFCRVWMTGPIPAGGSITLAFPVKLLVEGDTDIVTEMSWGEPTAGLYPNIVRIPVPFHINPAPPKVGGGGGGGGTGGTALPDLQTSVKASTGTPRPGVGFNVLFTTKNAGKADAPVVSFVGEVAAGLTVPFAPTMDGWECTIAPNAATGGTTVTCPGGPTTVGTSHGVQIFVNGAPAGAYAFRGTFTSSIGDANPADDSAALTVTVK